MNCKEMPFCCWRFTPNYPVGSPPAHQPKRWGNYCRLAASHLALQEIPHVKWYIIYSSSIQFKHGLFQFQRDSNDSNDLTIFSHKFLISWYPNIPTFSPQNPSTKSHSPVSPCQANHTLVAHTWSKNHPPNCLQIFKDLFFRPRHTSSPRLSLQQLDSSYSTGLWILVGSESI